MAERPKLDGRPVVAKQLAEKLWLVGWLFETKKSGEKTVDALASLYNAFDEHEKAKGSK